MKQMANLFLQRAVLFNLVGKQLKTKYAGSVLGVFWALIHPLLLALVVSFVFTEILRINVEHYYLFVISGMLPWTFLANSLQEAVVSLPANSPVLKQFVFPREFIPTSLVFSNLLLFMLGLLVVLPLFLYVKMVHASMGPILAAAVLLQTVFVLGLSLLLSVAYVYCKDIYQLLNVLLIFWLWVTPVFYSIAMIPPEYRVLFELNPMTPYINLYRKALLGGGNNGVALLLHAFIVSAAALGLGCFVFYRWGRDLLKRI